MKNITAATLSLSLGLLVLAACSSGEGPKDEPAQNVITGGWQGQFIGRDETVAFYPDAYANYWTFHFEQPASPIGLRISGDVPKARYFSFNLYNDINFTSVAALSDQDISINSGRYEIVVIPESHTMPDAQNVLTYEAGLIKIALIVRLYVPEQGISGGVALPNIEAFDLKTGEPVALPQPTAPKSKPVSIDKIEALVMNKVGGPLAHNIGGDLRSYRVSSGGLYANKDNQYLVMPVKHDPDQYAVIRFKPPGFGQTPADVRYWSLSLGDTKSFNFWTLHDDQATKAPDGFIYVVIGDHAPKGLAGAYNFRGWQGIDPAVLIYRHLLPQKTYANAFDQVPVLDESQIEAGLSATQTIGDTAPIGVLVSKETLAEIEDLSSLF
ncbi:MAG: hypothetical protein V3V30_05945 [Parvularculaceae bacterium]